MERPESKQEEGEDAAPAGDVGTNAEAKGIRSPGGKDVFVGAFKIDLKALDYQLEKAWSKVEGFALRRPREAWEIDLSKLHVMHTIAGRTYAYGTRCRGNYDGQDVAVKIVDRASFQQEVAVCHKLDHPNVAKFVGASMGDSKFVGASMGDSHLRIPRTNPTSNLHNPLPAGACCVVAEYLPGGTLKQFLITNRRKKLAYKVVIQLALDLARGLSYLHSQKIVHRDVKTENMSLDSLQTLKIADFGVARVEAECPEDMTGETGALSHRAPEVLLGKQYHRSCDVYSFGICLWEIYCCDVPYADLGFAEVSSAVVRQNLRPKIPRCCPKSLASIMRKCWDANAEKRPDMAEVVRLLESIDTSKGGGMIPEDQMRGCFCFTPTRGP